MSKLEHSNSSKELHVKIPINLLQDSNSTELYLAKAIVIEN